MTKEVYKIPEIDVDQRQTNVHLLMIDQQA
jgi:hypothetical protein